MSIKPLHIETIFADAIHLLWLILLALCLLGKSPDIIFTYLSKIESGTAVFLIAVSFSVAFFIGRIAEDFLSVVNYFFRKKNRQEYTNNFKGTTGEIWANKIFALNASIGLLFFVTALVIVSEGNNIRKTIIVMGLILLIGTVSSFLYWYNFGKRKNL
jgi:hypothetical protein